MLWNAVERSYQPIGMGPSPSRNAGWIVHERSFADGYLDRSPRLDGDRVLLKRSTVQSQHCRFTGPYYLAAVIPVAIAGMGVLPLGLYGWAVLGILILGGSYVIWWGTERAWGKFSNAP